MIDSFSLLLSHGLLLYACWRLIWREDLNQEAPPPPDSIRPAFGRNPSVDPAAPGNPDA